MSAHHRHAELDGAVVLEVGTVAKDVWRHGIGEGLDDAGHDEQKHPKEDVYPLQEQCQEDADEVAIAVEEMTDAEGVVVLVPVIGKEGHAVAPSHRDEEDGQG